LAALHNLMERHPTDPELWLRHGQLLRNYRIWPEAVDALKKAMDLSPMKNRSPYRRASTDLQGALFQWKPHAEATVAWLSILKVPPRDSLLPERCLDLSSHFNSSLLDPWHNRALPSNHLSVLPTGRQTFNGINFDVRGVIQIASKSTETLEPGFPEAVRGIEIGAKCRRLHFLHAAAFAYRPQKDGKFVGYGQKIASYAVHYADGSKQELPLISGENIDEWHVGVWSVEPTQAITAWEGRIDFGATARLYLFSWENPRPDVALKSLDFVSTMSAGAAFLIAVTVEP
jgi:hypothetical protein